MSEKVSANSQEGKSVDVDASGSESNSEESGGKVRGSRKPHGKGFIYWSLRDAEDALRKIDHHAKRMSHEGFARALGHKRAEGRFSNKLEALKFYKLAEEDGEDVVLTPLAIDMLYGGSEATRTKARTAAFLNYEDFNKTFAECPKGQDHPLQYIIDYVKGKLGIVNEVERFKKLFLDSAHFAGLLEGELDPATKSIRMRHATALPANGNSATRLTERKPDSAFEVIGGEQKNEVLAAFGISGFADRTEVAQKVSGKVSQSFDDGQLVLEVNRPVRVTIKSDDILIDFPEIVKAMRAKGLSI